MKWKKISFLLFLISNKNHKGISTNFFHQISTALNFLVEIREYESITRENDFWFFTKIEPNHTVVRRVIELHQYFTLSLVRSKFENLIQKKKSKATEFRVIWILLHLTCNIYILKEWKINDCQIFSDLMKNLIFYMYKK